MAGDDVQVNVCQQELVKLYLKLKALIKDIDSNTYDMQQLQECNFQVRIVIKSIRDRIEELGKLAVQQDREVDKITLLQEVTNQKNQLASNLLSLRGANVSCNIRIQNEEKNQLLQSGVRSRNNQQQDMAKNALHITEKLMDVRQSLAAQIARSNETMSSLITSSQNITENQEELVSQGGHIQNSSKLLTKYSRRECTDKLLILLAMIFFFATVLYITKKRVWGSTTEYIIPEENVPVDISNMIQ